MMPKPARFRRILAIPWRATFENIALGLQIVALIAIGGASYRVWRSHRVTPRAKDELDAALAKKSTSQSAVSLEGAQVVGDRSAKVGIIEFTDFECPFCKAFATETLPRLQTEYVQTGKVLLAFRFLPLQTLHPQALSAAQAGACAAQQGRFWAMHDSLFARPRSGGSQVTAADAERMGLNGLAFDECMKTGTPTVISNDLSQAKTLRITGTPTFLIGTVSGDGTIRVAGRASRAVSFDEFKKALDKLLGSARASTN